MHVLILDDHRMFRDGISHVLSTVYSMYVHPVGTVEAAVEVIRTEPIDIALVDYDLGSSTGADFVKRARNGGFTGRILIVTAGFSDANAVRDMDGMISGIVLKNQPTTTLAETIEAVAAGRECPEARFLTDRVREDASERGATFTPSERETLEHVANGLSNKQIGTRMQLSEAAVKGILQRLFHKTGTRSRAQLVRIFLENYSG